MAETASMRVVPSGKIYRQMFDAQVIYINSIIKKTREQVSESLQFIITRIICKFTCLSILGLYQNTRKSFKQLFTVCFCPKLETFNE